MKKIKTTKKSFIIITAAIIFILTACIPKTTGVISMPDKSYKGTWYADHDYLDFINIESIDETEIKFELFLYRNINEDMIAKIEDNKIKFKNTSEYIFIGGTMEFLTDRILLNIEETLDIYTIEPGYTYEFFIRNENASIIEYKTAELFYPDDDVTGFYTKIAFTDGTPEHIVSLLTDEGILPAGVTLLSFTIDGNRGYADMNTVYGNTLRGTGTTGEQIYIGVLVNTLLRYYNLEEIVLTEEGKVIKTGHMTIDFPIRFIERY